MVVSGKPHILPEGWGEAARRTYPLSLRERVGERGFVAFMFPHSTLLHAGNGLTNCLTQRSSPVGRNKTV